jgi:hypothetical protein
VLHNPAECKDNVTATSMNGIPSTEENSAPIERPCLIGMDGEYQGQVLALAARTKLGRHPENDVRLHDPTVSAFHTQITLVESGYEVMDLRSKNGTKRNGQLIRRPVILADKDRITIGKSTFRFRLPISPGGENGPRTSEASADSASDRSPPARRDIIPGGKTPEPSQEALRRPADLGEAPGGRSSPARAPQGTHPPPTPKSNGAGKTTRVLLYVVLGILQVSIVVLVVLRFVAGTPSASHPSSGQGARPAASPRGDPSRVTLCRQIWHRWESQPAENEVFVSDAGPLLHRVSEQVDHLRDLAPAAQWELYRTCVQAVRTTRSAPEDSERRKQAEEFLQRVKTEMEGEELQHQQVLSEAVAGQRHADALQIVHRAADLFDLRHDNKDSELAGLYQTLEQEIRHQQNGAKDL